MFPAVLLGGSGFERLLAVAEPVPLCVIDHPFGFEFKLGRDEAEADFCVVAAPGSALAAHYVREGAAAPPGSPAAGLRDCLDPGAGGPAGAFLARGEGGVILEYDVPAALATPSDDPRRPCFGAPPGIFFVPRGGGREDAGRLFADSRETAAAVWAAAGWSAGAAELRRFERVFEILSGAGLIAQAGVLPGRPFRAVRLVAHHIDVEEAPRLLERLRWPGSVDTVVSVLAETSGLVQAGAAFSLDVSADGVSPRLGIEMFRREDDGGGPVAGWRPVVDRLVEKGWCAPVKAGGLRAWSGAAPVFGPGGVFRVFRRLNHLKAVVSEGRVAAKAYAAMTVRRVEG